MRRFANALLIIFSLFVFVLINGPDSNLSAAADDYLIPLKKEMYVSSNGKAYKEATKSSSKRGSIKKGERVSVIGKKGNGQWYLIKRDGKIVGYVESSLLSPKKIFTKKKPATVIPSNASKVKKDVSTAPAQNDVALLSTDVPQSINEISRPTNQLSKPSSDSQPSAEIKELPVEPVAKANESISLDVTTDKADSGSLTSEEPKDVSELFNSESENINTFSEKTIEAGHNEKTPTHEGFRIKFSKNIQSSLFYLKNIFLNKNTLASLGFLLFFAVFWYFRSSILKLIRSFFKKAITIVKKTGHSITRLFSYIKGTTLINGIKKGKHLRILLASILKLFYLLISFLKSGYLQAKHIISNQDYKKVILFLSRLKVFAIKPFNIIHQFLIKQQASMQSKSPAIFSKIDQFKKTNLLSKTISSKQNLKILFDKYSIKFGKIIRSTDNKKLIPVTIILFIFIFCFSEFSLFHNTPEEIAEKYIKAVKTDDIRVAWQLTSEDYIDDTLTKEEKHQSLEKFKKDFYNERMVEEVKSYFPINSSFKIISTKNSGDKTVIFITVSYPKYEQSFEDYNGRRVSKLKLSFDLNESMQITYINEENLISFY